MADSFSASESRSSQSTITLPASPLDNIPPQLFNRFPRFSTTTEISQPDLSLEDVTSTRFSIDEGEIISIPYGQDTEQPESKKEGKLHRTLRKAVSHQNVLKRASLRIKRVPSSLGFKRPVFEPIFDENNKEPHILENAPPHELSIDHSPSPKVTPFYRCASKLSALEEHRPSFEDRSIDVPAVTHDVAPKRSRRQPVTHFPPATARFKFPASTTTVNSWHTAQERMPSRRPSFARSASSSRQNSLISLSQTIVPSRSFSRPVSARSMDDHRTLPILQRDPMYIDMPNGHAVDFVFPTHPPRLNSSLSLRSISSLRPQSSYPQSQPVIRSGNFVGAYEKIPLFVPSRIERHDEPFERDSVISESNWSMGYFRNGDVAGDQMIDADLESDSAAIRGRGNWFKRYAGGFHSLKLGKGCGSRIRGAVQMLKGLHHGLEPLHSEAQ